MTWVVMIAAVAALGAPAAPEKPELKTGPDTGLTWDRPLGARQIAVTATPGGPDLARAEATIRRIAERLDALRTLRPHVAWTRIQWHDGRVEASAVAETALYGNVALLAARALLPGYGSIGSHVQTMGTAEGAEWGWRIRMLLTPPASRAPKPEKAPAP